MSITEKPGQVALASDQSALRVLHALLTDAVAAFPQTMAKVDVPTDAQTFRKTYADVLPVFEAARAAGDEGLQIARHMVAALSHYVVWQDDAGQRPLTEALAAEAPPLPLNMHAFDGQPGWRPDLVYRGERWESARLAELGDLLVERNVVTQAAGEALAWIAAHALADGSLNLTGRRIALLGAGAEMAPTRLWLEAGADVLWLDTQAPPQNWWQTSGMSGRLFWPDQGTDLLSQPQAVLATLREFSSGAPLDLGLYAYAPGQARELRLCVVMNEIVNALPRELLGSVTMLVSPTTPTVLWAQDIAAMHARLASRPVWEALCAGVGLLGKGGGAALCGQAAATRTVVPIQGASYQVAQYLGKILSAQVWSADGQLADSDPQPLRVSANTAAITRTRSLAHPVFAAAFGGAAAFGVETLTPRQSRRINGLLAVRDWLQPSLPTPGTVRVHGGIHTLPYPLGSALRVAAAIGFVRSPRLLRGLLGR